MVAWLRERFIAIAFVIGLHGLVGLALATQRIVADYEPPPMIVSLLEVPTISEQPPPPAVPHFEPLQLPPLTIPEMAPIDEAVPAAITVAAAPSAPESAPAVTAQEPIAEARFDVNYLNNPPPTYPVASRRMREEGLVVLRVKVRADGRVDAVLVHQRSGSMRLDEAALAAVKHWKFIPAKRGSQPIDSWVLVPIQFELKA